MKTSLFVCSLALACSSLALTVSSPDGRLSAELGAADGSLKVALDGRQVVSVTGLPVVAGEPAPPARIAPGKPLAIDCAARGGFAAIFERAKAN